MTKKKKPKSAEPYEFTVHFNIPGGEMQSVLACMELMELCVKEEAKKA